MNKASVKPDEFVSNPGSRYHTIYQPIVNDNGTIELVEEGKEDIVQAINSFKDSTDMSFLLQRMAMGDTSVLNPNLPIYADLTQMPKTYAEALQLQIDAKREFYKLPPELREKFNNNVNEWIATAGEESWMRSMFPEKFEVKEDEVNTDES